MKTNKTAVVKDFVEKSIWVSREFSAPLENVWRAHTEADLLELWWAPLPWRAETKYMNFSEGGYWLYAMISPEDQKQWGRMNYIKINHHKDYQMEDYFCDESGEINDVMPASKGQVSFTTTATGTKVEFKTYYASEDELKKIVEMGFEQGITMCMEQLEELFIQNKI